MGIELSVSQIGLDIHSAAVGRNQRDMGIDD